MESSRLRPHSPLSGRTAAGLLQQNLPDHVGPQLHRETSVEAPGTPGQMGAAGNLDNKFLFSFVSPHEPIRVAACQIHLVHVKTSDEELAYVVQHHRNITKVPVISFGFCDIDLNFPFPTQNSLVGQSQSGKPTKWHQCPL